MFHDPWTSHAVIYHGLYQFPTASGQYALLESFTLKDLIQWWYPITFRPTSAEALVYQDSYQNYRAPSGVVGYFGEWFNYYERALPFDKFPNSDLAAFLASH